MTDPDDCRKTEKCPQLRHILRLFGIKKCLQFKRSCGIFRTKAGVFCQHVGASVRLDRSEGEKRACDLRFSCILLMRGEWKEDSPQLALGRDTDISKLLF